MGRLRTIRATICHAATINCYVLTAQRTPKMEIFNFTGVQKYRGIPVFWRVSKPEKWQADRLWYGTVRAPQSAIHPMAVANHSAKLVMGGMRPYGINLARGTEFWPLTTPIRLYPAARSQRTYLHQVHDKCHTRLRQPLFCPTCNRIVSRHEVVVTTELPCTPCIFKTRFAKSRVTERSPRTCKSNRRR
jgi:hypothetical protein